MPAERRRDGHGRQHSTEAAQASDPPPAWLVLAGGPVRPGAVVICHREQPGRPSEEHFQRVSGFLESGRAGGATALAGGGRLGGRGYFIDLTVLTIPART